MIDSLPYADLLDLDEAERMLQAELSNPPCLELDSELFKDYPTLLDYLNSVATTKTDAIDKSRLQLDIKDTKDALANCKAQLEYQQNRLANLENLRIHGNDAWLMHNHQVEHFVKTLDQQTEQINADIVKINQERKQNQVFWL